MTSPHAQSAGRRTPVGERRYASQRKEATPRTGRSARAGPEERQLTTSSGTARKGRRSVQTKCRIQGREIIYGVERTCRQKEGAGATGEGRQLVVKRARAAGDEQSARTCMPVLSPVCGRHVCGRAMYDDDQTSGRLAVTSARLVARNLQR